MGKKLHRALVEIEAWLVNAPRHPTVQYGVSTDNNDFVVGIAPMAVDTWNADAMLAEWRHLREKVTKQES